MYDILIPYVHSEHNELRYALRSIEKCQPDSNVTIIGDVVPWFKGEHIYHTRNSLTRQLNVRDKIIAAIPHLSDDFILWYDDLYQLAPGKVMPSHCGLLKDIVKKELGQWFKSCIINTMTIYPDGIYYGNHHPIVINGVKFIEAMNVNWKKDYLVKSLYGNYVQQGGEYISDCKYRHGDIRKFIQGRQFLSTDIITKDVLTLLKELFPDKSKFER